VVCYGDWVFDVEEGMCGYVVMLLSCVDIMVDVVV